MDYIVHESYSLLGTLSTYWGEFYLKYIFFETCHFQN